MQINDENCLLGSVNHFAARQANSLHFFAQRNERK
jgi:hypothetical protein